MATSAEELPAYTPETRSPSHSVPPQGIVQPRPRTAHTYSLETKGKPWLSIQVSSSRAQSSKTLPVFYDGDNVEGTVEVDLDKGESAKEIIIKIIAATTTVGQEEARFLEVSHSLWTPTSGEKLKGTLSWPFSLPIPATVELEQGEKGSKSKFDTPPTFTERASPGYLDYRLVVIVKKSAFKVDQILSTNFLYWSRSTAGMPSPLRREAYVEGHSIIGPDGDPEGWKRLEDVTIKGILFDAKDVEVKYEFAIAMPLSYAIGSPIPVLCTLTCANDQALDLLSQPSAISLHLSRTLAIGSTAADRIAHQGRNVFKQNSAKGYWWPSAAEKPVPGKRFIVGEVQVRKGLKPSSTFPRLSVYYDLILLPPKATGFVPKISNPLTPLFSLPVEICTSNPAGVVPRSDAPPGYVHEEEGNYSTTVALLENGNQRFLGNMHELG